MAPYCGYFMRGLCKFGAQCRFSHSENDKPIVMKKAREAAVQWTLVCILCNIKIVEENEWFGLTECAHVFCFECLQNQKTSTSSPEQKKKKGKKGKKGKKEAKSTEEPKEQTVSCPQCATQIDSFCPSGIFLEKKEERKKALQYFKNHEYSILDAYSNRHRRTAKCGFSKACTRKVELPDGSILCQHSRFDARELEGIRAQRREEWEAERRDEEKNREIVRKAGEFKEIFYNVTMFIIVFGLVSQYTMLLIAQSGLMAEEPVPPPSPPVVVNRSALALANHLRVISRGNTSSDTCQTMFHWSLTRNPAAETAWNVEVFDGNGRLVDNFCFLRGFSAFL